MQFLHLYIVLFSAFFTISIGIATYFVYPHWCLKNDDFHVMLGTCSQTTIEKRNNKNRGYYSSDDMINIEDFHSNLLKIAKKLHEDIDICYIS